MTTSRTHTDRAVALSDATLPDLPDAVSVPGYDRAALVPGIVHIGVGGFHRAHAAVYLDDLAQRGETDWGVVGIGLHRPEMSEVLAAQDRLYVVVERDAEGDSAQVIGVMVGYLFAPEDPEAVLAALSDERTRVVTLTITGSSYNIDPDSGEFEADVAEVADLEDCGPPAGVFG